MPPEPMAIMHLHPRLLMVGQGPQQGPEAMVVVQAQAELAAVVPAPPRHCLFDGRQPNYYAALRNSSAEQVVVVVDRAVVHRLPVAPVQAVAAAVVAAMLSI